MAEVPKTVSQLYPSKWLKASDLEKPFSLEIIKTEFKTVYDSRSKEHVLKLVVSFKGAQKRLIPNKTQCETIWAITGSETFSDWVGHTMTLSPGKAHNNKPTIIISQAAQQTTQQNVSPSVEGAQDEIDFNQFFDDETSSSSGQH